MRTIHYLLVTIAFVLSIGTAMAENHHNTTGPDGFHALSQVTSSSDHTMTELTDEQLSEVRGQGVIIVHGYQLAGRISNARELGWVGYTPHPDPPIGGPKVWPPFPKPCWSCPYPWANKLSGVRDTRLITHTFNTASHVGFRY